MPIALLAGLVLALRLPRSQPEAQLTYGQLLGSLTGLWREFPALRRAAFTQALLFAAFSAFWTVLALHLQEPRFGLGADIAGLFGILGATGILAAPIAGRIADCSGPHRVILLGAILTLASWLTFGLLTSIAGLAVGVVLLDFAVQSALVSNQHVVYALRPDARSRLNTISMGTMFLGGSAGSSAAMLAWRGGGWNWVAMLGVALGTTATALQAIRHARS